MSGWGRRGGAHLLLGGASVPLATCGQGGVQGPFLQRTEPEAGRWPGHLELAGEAGDAGSPGGWEAGAGKGEALTEREEGVCLQCAYWQGWLTNRGPQGTPSLYLTSLGFGWGPMLSSWISEPALSPANPKETLDLIRIRFPFVPQMLEHQILVH